jgi:hypothetical protein
MIELSEADRAAMERIFELARTTDSTAEATDYYRAGLAAGIERAAKRMESESTNTAIKIRALLK